MDVTPELIEQIDFTERFRGFDQEQVDDFLDRVSATISRLSAELNDANERLRRAEANAGTQQRPQPAARIDPAATAAAEEAQAQEATRTLLLAQRTADAALAEAREEAAKLTAEAKSTHEEAIREASSEAESLLSDARDRAKSEFEERRAEIEKEISDLETAKLKAADDLNLIENRADHYRGALAKIETSIKDFLENPDSLGEQPPLDVDLSPPARETFAPERDRSVSQPTSSGLDNDRFGSPTSDRFGSDVPDRFGAGFDSSDKPSSPEDGSFADQYDSDSFSSEPSPRSNPFAAVPSPQGEEPEPEAWGPGSWSQIAGDEPTDPNDRFSEPSAFEGSFGSFSSESEQTPPSAFTEGPGSSGDFEFVSMESDDAFGGPPTEAHRNTQGDPFMADLDAAVNSDTDESDAMSAFFEGDNDPQMKRFGRRR